MKNALEIHNFSQKLNARMVELGFYEMDKSTKKAALITLNNRLYPSAALTYKDIPPRKFYDWLSGKKIPDNDTLVSLCNVLEVDFEYFFGENTPPTRAIGDISETLRLSPKAIENLMKYDSGLLKMLDALICTPVNDSNYPGYTGTLEAFLKTLWDFGNRAGTSKVELITPGLKPETITDNHIITELLKRPPIEFLNKCLLIASQTQSDYMDDKLSESLEELKTKLLEIQKGGD